MRSCLLVLASAASASAVALAAPSTDKIAKLKLEGLQTIERRAAVSEQLQQRTQSASRSALFPDEAALIEAQGFAFSETQLIEMTKDYLFLDAGLKKPSLLADDMVFMGPFVGGAGGLPRDDYLKAVGGFDIKAAFPDLAPNFHHFRADPYDAGRVWFTSTATGTDMGGFLGNEPTGKRFETPPQACSVKWNADGKVIKYTIGHVMERSLGNTGGLGGIFGPAYAIGKPLPFPEANPWKPSKRYRMIQLIGRLATKLNDKKG